MIDCREAVRRMWDYLEASLGATPTEEFEEHLQTCQRCCGELEFNRHVRETVAAREGRDPIPAELAGRIEILLAGTGEGGGAS
jgi:anti-sigma factor (TIGR02949 family)